MPEHEFSELLVVASRKFSEGCLCEDSGECAFCQFVIYYLTQRRLCRALPIAELSREMGIYEARFDIPIGDSAQIFELRRIFRL